MIVQSYTGGFSLSIDYSMFLTCQSSKVRLKNHWSVCHCMR
jgi:hypothetical protein